MSREIIGNINHVRVPHDVPMVFAFDPGKSTGWAMYSLDRERPWLSWGQGRSVDVLLGFRHLLCQMSPATIVASETVIERYTIPGRPTGKTEDIAAAFEVIGALKLLLTIYGMQPPTMRLPVTRKISSNKMLTRLGWIGPDRKLIGRDATSAVQHLASYLVDKHAVPLTRNVVG